MTPLQGYRANFLESIIIALLWSCYYKRRYFNPLSHGVWKTKRQSSPFCVYVEFTPIT